MWWIYFLFQLSQKRGSIRSPGHANESTELADLAIATLAAHEYFAFGCGSLFA